MYQPKPLGQFKHPSPARPAQPQSSSSSDSAPPLAACVVADGSVEAAALLVAADGAAVADFFMKAAGGGRGGGSSSSLSAVRSVSCCCGSSSLSSDAVALPLSDAGADDGRGGGVCDFAAAAALPRAAPPRVALVARVVGFGSASIGSNSGSDSEEEGADGGVAGLRFRVVRAGALGAGLGLGLGAAAALRRPPRALGASDSSAFSLPLSFSATSEHGC